MRGAARRPGVATGRFALCLSVCALIGGCAFDSNPERSISARVDGGAAATADWAADPLVNPPSLATLFDQNLPEAAAADATLVRRFVSSPTTLNPIFSGIWEDYYVGALLYSGLFRRLQSMELEPDPNVVVDYQESDGGRVVMLRLTDRLTWQDGEPWTAHDVEWSWRAITDDRVPASAFKTYASELEDVRAIDDRTVRFVHREALATKRLNMSFPIIPRHVFGVEERRAEDPTLRTSAYYNRHARDEVIGSGPYRLVEWRSNDRLEIERWDDYPFAPPRFRRQVLKIQPDANSALLLFKKGELHEMALTPQQFARETSDDAFRRVGVKGLGPRRRMIAFVGFNQTGSNPFFADARVRRAMAHAFDLDRALRDAGYGLYPRSTGPFDGEHWAHDPSVAPVPYDPARARALLDEAGWLASDEDGWRYREIDGRCVRFEFELLSSGDATVAAVADRFGEDLRAVGVAMTRRVQDSPSVIARLRDHDFEGWVGAIEASTDPDWWRQFFTTAAIASGRNYVGYRNARVDELFLAARLEQPREERARIYREIQRLLYDDQAFLFLWEYRVLWAFSNRLRGVELSAGGPFGFWPGWTAWWVAEPPDG